MRYAITFIVLLIGGCQSIPEKVAVPVAVSVEHDVYVPLDPALLADCENRPAIVKDGSTNGQLRESLLAWELVYGPCLLGKLESIRNLQPGNAHNP